MATVSVDHAGSTGSTATVPDDRGGGVSMMLGIASVIVLLVKLGQVVGTSLDCEYALRTEQSEVRWLVINTAIAAALTVAGLAWAITHGRRRWPWLLLVGPFVLATMATYNGISGCAWRLPLPPEPALADGTYVGSIQDAYLREAIVIEFDPAPVLVDEDEPPVALWVAEGVDVPAPDRVRLYTITIRDGKVTETAAFRRTSTEPTPSTAPPVP